MKVIRSHHVFFILILLIHSFSLNSQNEKFSIGVLPFTSSQNYHFNPNEALHQKVTNALVNSGRFVVVERSRMDALAREKDYQMGYDFSNSQVMIEQGHAIGAQFLLTGHINSIVTEQNKITSTSGPDKYTYGCKISLTIKVIDVQTGQVRATETLTPSAGIGLLGVLTYSDTEQGAWEAASEGISNSMGQFIKKEFPLVFQIIQIEDAKRGKAQEVLINGGSNLGLTPGTKLTVYELTEIKVGDDTIIRELEISKLTVKDVEGDRISKCKVNKDGDVLLQKFELGTKIICKTE